MRILPVLVLIGFLTSCDSNREAIAPGETSAGQAGAIDQGSSGVDALETDSVRIFGNSELRTEMLELMDKANIWYTVIDDNVITYFLADGKEIDKIYWDVRLAYIRRN